MTTTDCSGSIAVRMYRGILGDCFLLRYLPQVGEPVCILVDCGVLQGVEDARQIIKRVVDDVHQTTGGVLDIVVVTHEHHDHLSGFLYEQERFQKSFVINELWLAWTEDPSDRQAAQLRHRFTKAKDTLSAVANSPLMGVDGKDDPRLKTVRALCQFMGVGVENPAGQLAVRPTGASTLQMLKDKATARATRYLEPGDVVSPAKNPGLRAYVLGPPRDEDRLRKDQPSSKASREVYLTDLNDVMALDEQIRQLGGVDLESQDLPFYSSAHQHPLKEIEALYAGGARPEHPVQAHRLYFSEEPWRKIENEWFDNAEALALKMDSDTNNTSLVLAFELPDRQVLLFPGDAQVGNWLSWGDRDYTSVDGKSVALDDLLGRVTLYKVGHHCSHNATLREAGLEKMTDPRLIAMIPVVSKVAEKHDWKMPYPDLYAALKARTHGRVIVGDSDPDAEAHAFALEPTSQTRPATISHDADQRWVEVVIHF
jgi:hypothetical protein